MAAHGVRRGWLQYHRAVCELNLHDYDGGVRSLKSASCAPPTLWHAPALAMPAAQVSPSDQYSTANGMKSSAEIQDVLLAAYYPGAFDVPSLLGAYADGQLARTPALSDQ